MKKNEAIHKCKLFIEVFSPKGTNEIYTVSVFDNRINDYRNEYIKERGISSFLDIADMKMSLNWNLNGDERKYKFFWGQSGERGSTGYACVFD